MKTGLHRPQRRFLLQDSINIRGVEHHFTIYQHGGDSFSAEWLNRQNGKEEEFFQTQEEAEDNVRFLIHKHYDAA